MDVRLWEGFDTAGVARCCQSRAFPPALLVIGNNVIHVHMSVVFGLMAVLTYVAYTLIAVLRMTILCL